MSTSKLFVSLFVCFSDQRLDLTRANANDTDQVKGQIVISLLSREQHNSSSCHENSATPVVQTVVDALGNVASPASPAGIQEAATASVTSPLPQGKLNNNNNNNLMTFIDKCVHDGQVGRKGGHPVAVGIT
jgi:hypothetical protein